MDATALNTNTKREHGGRGSFDDNDMTEHISLDLRRTSSTSSSTATLRDAEQNEPLIYRGIGVEPMGGNERAGGGVREDVDLEGLKEVMGRRRESEDLQSQQPAKISPWIMSECTLEPPDKKRVDMLKRERAPLTFSLEIREPAPQFLFG